MNFQGTREIGSYKFDAKATPINGQTSVSIKISSEWFEGSTFEFISEETSRTIVNFALSEVDILISEKKDADEDGSFSEYHELYYVAQSVEELYALPA